MLAKPVTKSTDPVSITGIVVCIYGDPGVGKTSLAFTAERPLLLDFDHGSHRAFVRKDMVSPASWADVAEIELSDLEGYKTLVIDTGGRAADFIQAAIPFSEGKTMLKTNSGNLTLQGYGMLKNIYTGWLKKITTFGIDVIIVCHAKEEKNGDFVTFRPDITGGSVQEIYKSCDFLGYMGCLDGKSVILDFNPGPNQAWLGKNAANLEPLRIPDFVQIPDFFSTIIERMKAKFTNQLKMQEVMVDEIQQHRKSASEDNLIVISNLWDRIPPSPKAMQKQLQNALVEGFRENPLFKEDVATLRSKLEAAKDVSAVNDIWEEVRGNPMFYQLAVWPSFEKFTVDLGLSYHKPSRKFVIPKGGK
jgi:hypothetical protein